MEKFFGKRYGCCGCVGGCNFFGKNLNGLWFFIVEKLDVSENDIGIGGFGSEIGFYDDGDIVDSGVRFLMYFCSVDLDVLGFNYFDWIFVGLIEVFICWWYYVLGLEGSFLKVRRVMYVLINEEVYLEFGVGKGIN